MHVRPGPCTEDMRDNSITPTSPAYSSCSRYNGKTELADTEVLCQANALSIYTLVCKVQTGSQSNFSWRMCPWQTYSRWSEKALQRYLRGSLKVAQDFSVRAVLVWRHFGHDISVHKQLIAFVYLNDYIGKRNVTLAGVIPTPFWGVMIVIKSEL